ncbi:MAG: hypothetical protein E4G94_00800 [ANME-2 cluster archaeon]|nr:MAG: hypothetical protein E4G94_00800 [ANME-2 cluster archaeon]
MRILIIFCCGILLIIGIASAVSDDITRITATQDSSERAPSFSPDGRFIAFESMEGGNDDIWIVNISTLELTRLTTDPSADSYPKGWSPDG